jgi:hypothetical protein
MAAELLRPYSSGTIVHCLNSKPDTLSPFPPLYQSRSSTVSRSDGGTCTAGGRYAHSRAARSFRLSQSRHAHARTAARQGTHTRLHKGRAATSRLIDYRASHPHLIHRHGPHALAVTVHSPLGLVPPATRSEPARKSSRSCYRPVPCELCSPPCSRRVTACNAHCRQPATGSGGAHQSRWSCTRCHSLHLAHCATTTPRFMDTCSDPSRYGRLGAMRNLTPPHVFLT